MCFLSEVIVIKKAIKYNVFQIDCNNFHKGEFYMSLISVNTEALKDIEKRFGTLSQKLGQAESNLKSIRSNLDSEIKSRNGIDSKLQNLTKELDEEEKIIDQVRQFLSKTIKQYQDLEKSMQSKVNELNGETKIKNNIFARILDAATSSIKKNIEIILKIMSLPIIGNPIIVNTVIKGVRDILSEKENEVANKSVEEVKEKPKNSSVPPLSGILSYNPNVYSEEVLMLQKRLNELYAGVSGYKKIKEDGYFGLETLAAVNRYKEEYGLWNFGEYEGKVGETTWNHLFKNEKVPYTAPVVRTNENITVSTYKIPISFEDAVKNEYNAKWYNREKGEDEFACVKKQGKDWVRATEAEIRYYMDPNNFVNDPVNKYQFLVLGNVGGFEITPQNREEIINRLNDLLKGRGVLDGKGEAFVKASEETGVSLPYLVAHCALETGWGTSKLANGLNKDGKYTGYYNMFGIGAYDSDPVTNGINKAKSEGWNSVEKAIIGGAHWIKENYISNPEKNTLYKMRWQPVSPLGNQYATDIAWAQKQCSTIKEVYELFPEAELIFDIPEYAFYKTEFEVVGNNGNTIGNTKKEEKPAGNSIPPLSGILSYNPNVYSEKVLMLQKRLNEIYAGVSGYEKLKEDGYFGPKTLAAVNRYKEEFGLWNFGEYEGKVGDTTWQHLFKNDKAWHDNMRSQKGQSNTQQPSNTQTVKNAKINEDILASEINKYVKFVYTDASGKKSKELQIYYEWGGKMSLEQLNKKMIELGLKADDPNLQSKITALAKDKNIMLGIDCSGFVLRVVDAATNGKASMYYKNSISELNNVKDVISWGVSSENMTSSNYSKKITNLSDVRPGDYICFDGGKHIGVIYKVEGDTIYYAHSSGSKGPHLGTIKVNEAGKNGLDLKKNATFNDWDANYSKTIQSLFNYICRPNFLL